MNIKYMLIVLIAGGYLLASCKKELNLSDPQGLNPQGALSIAANVKRVFQGGYDALSSSSLYGGDIQILADLSGSDGELSWKRTYNNYRGIWGKNIINIANSVLNGLPVVAACDKNRVQGEALFMRGAMHFELVRFYSRNYTDGSAASNAGVPGFSIHDAIRFQRTVDGKPWNDNRLIFPIPFRELIANSSLTQNAGY